MRSLSVLLLVLLSSCAAWNRSPGEAHVVSPLPVTSPAPEDSLATLTPARSADLPKAPSAPPPTPQAHLPTAVHRTTARGIALTFLTFDDRNLTLRVADKAGGPETEWPSAQAAAQAHRAVAAINASFFTPVGDPLGLVIEDGARFGSWNNRSSITSGVLAVRNGKPELLRRAQWPSTRPAEQLVQAGPFLLEHGAAVAGLSTTPSRPRSFVAWDGHHHWALGSAASATLAELATALATHPLPQTRFSLALNLDGGRSCDFWASSNLPGGPVSTRRFWNNPVRNYILLTEHP